MKMQIAILTLVMSTGLGVEAGTIVEVRGRVRDTKNNPVVGARIARFWFIEEATKLLPERHVRSGMDGQFSMEFERNRDDICLMAIDDAQTMGCMVLVSVKSPQEPIEIEMAPLAEIRVRYGSEGKDRALGDTHLTLTVGDQNFRIAGGRSLLPEFRMKMPAGCYTLRVEERCHVEDVREVTLKSGKILELGVVELKLSKFAKLIDQPAPAWHVTDARGVSKDVQPSDFRGKWVVLEFWGFWCSPCIHRGLPGWIDFADDHEEDRDKFVILAVHDPQATDFEMLDEKLLPIIRRTWCGRSLPFPILLDTSGQMVNDYGVQAWPTAVLINPEGRIVDIPRKRYVSGSAACEDFLASKLTPRPPSKVIASVLDRRLSIAVDDEQKLVDVLDFIAAVARTTIAVPRSELRAARISEDAKSPLKLSGTLTLRAWLNVLLGPFELSYVGDGNGLRIVRRSAETLELSQPSRKQTAENTLIELNLQRKVTIEFHRVSLKQVIETLESKTGESFVLDPSYRMWDNVSFETPITASATDEPLASFLGRLLAPLGMTYVVQNEAVFLTKAR